MSNTFFTGDMNLEKRLQAIHEGHLPDSLVVIDQLEQAIGWLHRQWLPPFTNEQVRIIRLLRDSQELVRKAHEVAWKEE